MNTEEKIQIDNYKAQYNSVMANIAVANDELQNVFRKTADAKSKLSSVESEMREKSAELDRIIRESESLNALADSKLATVEKAEQYIAQKQADLELRVNAESKKREDEIRIHERKRQELESQIKENTDEFLKLVKSVSIQKEANKEINQIVREKIDERNRLENEVRQLESQMRDASETFTKKIEKYKKELEEAQRLVQEEKEKVARPLEFLKLREAVVAKKEKNLNIMVNRFKKEFKKLHPNLEIKL